MVIDYMDFINFSRWFAYFMHLFTKERDAKVEEIKKDLFSSLSSITSHDPELRKKNAIRILEIGVGTGSYVN